MCETTEARACCRCLQFYGTEVYQEGKLCTVFRAGALSDGTRVPWERPRCSVETGRLSQCPDTKECRSSASGFSSFKCNLYFSEENEGHKLLLF